MITYANNNTEITCVSDDTKPTNVLTNALALELDTGDFYYFDGTDWQPVGGEVSNAPAATLSLSRPNLQLQSSFNSTEIPAQTDDAEPLEEVEPVEEEISDEDDMR